MIDIELLKKYGIVGSTIYVKKCGYAQLFDNCGWKEPKQCEQVKQFYKHYDKFKKKKRNDRERILRHKT